ncbi:MAG: DNA-binding response regulator [Runella slithyformis]|nr:MAG: DNA-binding response regulator [Runella slithyformis]TAF94519.1 MAG: DNA-binding response regulator [Runella sp.]TAG17540.1 MAG: DNA-binding response regulator [Cytophagales bacterium]TAG36513.1 MAG: DNA-binding response regulator [Cytophagia bacterium]TAF24326.1 MAG: DNA-binding response regulator [Runella slithyformis]
MSKILYVEDEPFLGKIVKESLESRGFEVRMVADGREVMAIFTAFQPDVCLLDVMLPHRDGYALAQDIRQIDAQMPILFLTAKTQTEDVVMGFQVGGNDYIRKPFSMEELIVRVQNLLQLTQTKTAQMAAPNEAVVLGKFVFYPNRYELKSDDQLRKLSHRETELLTILCENRNFTVSRRDILLRVWGDDSFFNSRNLDVYITRLREYLRQDSSLEILTLKGVGYLFKCNFI